MRQMKPIAHTSTKVSHGTTTAGRHVHPHLEKTDDSAFLHRMRSSDSFAEQLGEGFVRTAVSGEDEGEDLRDAITTEELGGLNIDSSSESEIDFSLEELSPIRSGRLAVPKS